MLGIFLDSETNGLNPRRHQILEIAFQIQNISTGEILETFCSPVAISKENWKNTDPKSLEINGFSEKELENAPTASLVGEWIKDIFKKYSIHRNNAVFICQNPSFDRAFFGGLIDPMVQEALQWPYHWLDLASMHWALGIKKAQEKGGLFPWEVGCSKDKIATFLGLPKETSPHRAMGGMLHLVLCYKTLVGFPDR